MRSKPFKFLLVSRTLKSICSQQITIRMKTTTEFTLPVLDSPENTIEVAELNLLSDPHSFLIHFGST